MSNSWLNKMKFFCGTIIVHHNKFCEHNLEIPNFSLHLLSYVLNLFSNLNALFIAGLSRLIIFRKPVHFAHAIES